MPSLVLALKSWSGAACEMERSNVTKMLSSVWCMNFAFPVNEVVEQMPPFNYEFRKLDSCWSGPTAHTEAARHINLPLGG